MTDTPTVPLPEKEIRLQHRGIAVVALLLLGLFGLTWLIEYMQVDQRASRWAYSERENWPLGHLQPWQWLLDYGTIPGFISTLLALLGWYMAQRWKHWYAWRRYLLVYGLVSVIGAGIFVNAILKEHSGRPRPREVIQFGGVWEYRPAMEFGTPGKGRSFPCGHCTMGFLFSTGIVFWQLSRVLSLAMLSGGLIYGSMISVGRLLQGGHFVSDALWSLGVLWVTLALLYYFVFQPPISENQPYAPLKPEQQRWLLLGLLLFLGILSALYIMRRPFYQDYRQEFDVPERIRTLTLRTNLEEDEVVLKTSSSGRGEVYIEGRGFALPDADFLIEFSSAGPGEMQTVSVRVIPEGYFAELETRMVLRLPGKLFDSTRIENVSVKTESGEN